MATERKSPRSTKFTPPGAAGSKIERLILSLPALIEKRKQLYADRAEEEARKMIQGAIERTLLTVEEHERPRAVGVVHALGFDLCGFELTVSNETAPEAGQGSDDFPAEPSHNLGPDGPVVPTERVEREDGQARKVGKARTS